MLRSKVWRNNNEPSRLPHHPKLSPGSGGSLNHLISSFAVSLSSSMGLMNIFSRKRGKIQPCLFFQRKTSNSPSTSHPHEKDLNKNNVAIIEEVRMAVFLAQGNLPRMSKKRKRDSPEEIALKKRSIEHTLRQRRNGICNEVERTWFLQGSYLEKHRHNLQVTHELTVRGLMWWCHEAVTWYFTFVIFVWTSRSTENAFLHNSLSTLSWMDFQKEEKIETAFWKRNWFSIRTWTGCWYLIWILSSF